MMMMMMIVRHLFHRISLLLFWGKKGGKEV